jgi:N-acetylmuramoyl-L-alanine amidase CwlA
VIALLKKLLGLLQQPKPEEYKIIDHWLHGPNVTHMPMHESYCPRLLHTKDHNPLALVMHETATPPGTGKNMAKRRQKKFNKATDRQSSWHITVEQDGSIIQMAPFNRVCWHAGSKTDRAIPGCGFANDVAVGLERVGYEDDTFIPALQQLSIKEFVRAFVRHYGTKREHTLVGHKWIDPTRKRDPGPAWDKVQTSVLDYAFRPIL